LHSFRIIQKIVRGKCYAVFKRVCTWTSWVGELYWLGGLNCFSIETLDLDTVKKLVFTSRKSRQLQKACLDDREVLIKIDKSRFCLGTIFGPKSLNPDQDLLRLTKRINFVLILIHSLLILPFFLIEIYQFVKIF